jgi:endonuclease/exonuclease/phosphatase family metal-dependent hydrolase
MWELIPRIKPCHQAPWLMIGGFNECLWSSEHFSNLRRHAKQLLDFREVLSFCDLHDPGFMGLPWTYDNKQKGQGNVRVRLDRVVESSSWSQWFPDVQLQHLVSSRSDHCPVFLNLQLQQDQRPMHRIMRYEIMWEMETSLSQRRYGGHGQKGHRFMIWEM